VQQYELNGENLLNDVDEELLSSCKIVKVLQTKILKAIFELREFMRIIDSSEKREAVELAELEKRDLVNPKSQNKLAELLKRNSRKLDKIVVDDDAQSVLSNTEKKDPTRVTSPVQSTPNAPNPFENAKAAPKISPEMKNTDAAKITESVEQIDVGEVRGGVPPPSSPNLETEELPFLERRGSLPI